MQSTNPSPSHLKKQDTAAPSSGGFFLVAGHNERFTLRWKFYKTLEDCVTSVKADY